MMVTSEKTPPTACERAMARYAETPGWRASDEVLFRAAWNEGAFERDRQLRAELDAARALLERVWIQTSPTQQLLCEIHDYLTDRPVPPSPKADAAEPAAAHGETAAPMSGATAAAAGSSDDVPATQVIDLFDALKRSLEERTR